jgi:hypothetical protein
LLFEDFAWRAGSPLSSKLLNRVPSGIKKGIFLLDIFKDITLALADRETQYLVVGGQGVPVSFPNANREV